MNSTEANDTGSTAAADTTTPAPSTDMGRRVLTGTVVWGVILLVVAALYGLRVASDLELVSVTLSPAWIVLSVGALFVVGGLVAALTRRR